MVWEHEEGRSQAMVFGVGLTLDNKRNKNAWVRVLK